MVSGARDLSVIGRGAVTLVDGSHVKTDAYRGKGYRPVMVSGAILHSPTWGTGSTCAVARCSPVRSAPRGRGGVDVTKAAPRPAA